MSRKILIPADHGGFDVKEEIKAFTFPNDLTWIDLGTHSADSVDYPAYGFKMAEAIKEGLADTGIIICGTGIGISIAANRFPHIRAALCTNPDMARLAREHNNANILALGARVTPRDTIIECVDIFLRTKFEGGRHAGRVDQLNCDFR